MRFTWLAIVCVATTPIGAATAQDEDPVYLWTADRDHSSLTFETMHWGVVGIVGWFEEYEIDVRSSALDFGDAVVEARINPASVRMPNPGMAENLRHLFFETDEYPEVLFRSTAVEKTEDPGVLDLVGTLTMKGVAKEVTFTVRFNGYASLPQGSPGFKLEGELDRLDFGIGDIEFMEETGNPLVDAIVQLDCNIRLAYVRTE